MEEPLGPVALLSVVGLILAGVWAVGKMIDVAVDIYCKMQRPGDE
jgi:hypothetical protein